MPSSFVSPQPLPFNHTSLAQRFRMAAPDRDPGGSGYWLMLRGDDLLVAGTPDDRRLPESNCEIDGDLHVGSWDSRPSRTGCGRCPWLACSVAWEGWSGFCCPALTAPPLTGSALMLTTGAAWGVYSLRGKRSGDPLATTAGNFLRAVPFAEVLSVWPIKDASLDLAGVGYAVISGAVVSGAGYAI